MELTTKRSIFWYILPIIFGLLGGVIVYFVLRKSDPSKAKLCLLLGFGITVVWFIWIYSPNSSDRIAEQEQEAEEQKLEAQEQEAFRLQIEQETRAQIMKEMEEQRVKELLEESYEPKIQQQTTQYDADLVASFHSNIDDIQSMPREVLKQCRAVNSYSDYLIFALVVAETQDQLQFVIEGTTAVMVELVLDGYDEHPTVGPKIKETTALFDSAGSCIKGLLAKYN